MDVFVFHNQSSLFILLAGQFVICIDYLDSEAVLSCMLDQIRAPRSAPGPMMKTTKMLMTKTTTMSMEKTLNY